MPTITSYTNVDTTNNNRLGNAVSGVAALTAATVTATSAIIGSSNSNNLPATDTFPSPESLIANDNMYQSVAVDLGSLLINGSLLNDTSLLADILNGSDAMGANATAGNVTASEDVGELIRMAATSVVLGLMILITIIGK